MPRIWGCQGRQKKPRYFWWYIGPSSKSCLGIMSLNRCESCAVFLSMKPLTSPLLHELSIQTGRPLSRRAPVPPWGGSASQQLDSSLGLPSLPLPWVLFILLSSLQFFSPSGVAAFSGVTAFFFFAFLGSKMGQKWEIIVGFGPIFAHLVFLPG